MVRDVTTKKKQVKSKKTAVTKRIRLCYHVRYVYTTVSGDRVVFDGAGSVQSVSEKDAKILLSKVRRGCNCGIGSRLNHIFEEV